MYFVNPQNQAVTQHVLWSYFGHLYVTEFALFVASAERAFRFDQDGSLRWKSEFLGLDGVLIHHIWEASVSGEGEWDPPGGWKPFAIFARSGRTFRVDA